MISRCPTAWLPLVLLFLVGTTPLCAVQFGATLDVGTGPATWDQVETDGARAQGTLGASYRSARMLGLQPELTGDFGLSTEQPVRTAFRWDVMGRLHTRGGVTGAWLGAGLGGVGTGGRTAALTRLEGGIRSGVGPAGFRVWLARTSFGVRPGVGGSFGDTLRDSTGAGGKQVVEYTDLGTRAALAFGRYEAGATLVRRWGRAALRSSALRSVAWEMNAVWWVRPSVGLVASVGHSLPELSLALPGARYRSLGVRLALGAPPRRGARSAGGAPPATGGTTAGTLRLVLATLHGLAIVGPQADRAEVMGDFTDWQPLPLLRAGEGRWALDTELSHGVHHLNLRFDGGQWLVPAGTVAVDDGFGGKVGMFVVR